jgi:hypothetical protein
MHVQPIDSLLVSSTNSTANARSASSVQQQADVLSLPSTDQFLSQLQQVQSPQQFQAMISQMTGQPQPADPAGHHCKGGGRHPVSDSSQSNALNALQAAANANTQNQGLIAAYSL